MKISMSRHPLIRQAGPLARNLICVRPKFCEGRQIKPSRLRAGRFCFSVTGNGSFTFDSVGSLRIAFPPQPATPNLGPVTWLLYPYKGLGSGAITLAASNNWVGFGGGKNNNRASISPSRAQTT
jgi:hypothetical protein